MATNPYQQYWDSLSSKNYAGSSGYWGDLGPSYTGSRDGMGYPGDRARNSLAARSGLSPQAAGTSPDSWDSAVSDSAIAKADGRVYSVKNGQPWNGWDPKSGKRYVNGLEAGSQAAFDDRYKARDVIKDPVVASEADKLNDTFAKTAADSLTDYQTILSQYKDQAAAAEAASKKAADITGTENALRGAQRQFSSGLDRASADYANLDATNAATQRGFVQQANNQLPEYDAALEAEKQQALAEARRQVGQYGLSKNVNGANLGLGSDETALALREAYKASLPFDMAKIQRKQQILQDIAIPTERDIANRETTRIGSFLPGIASQQYSSSQATNQAVQSLRTAAASQDWETMQRIMSVPELAAQVRQRIQSGDTQLLAAIAQLRANSRYQGLEDTYGVNVSQPQYFSQANPGYPGAIQPTVFGPNYPTATTNGGGAAPATGGVPSAYNPDGTVNPAYTAYRKMLNQQNQWMIPGNTTSGFGPDSQANSVYDPISQTYRDRKSGVTTGYAPGYYDNPDHATQQDEYGNYVNA